MTVTATAIDGLHVIEQPTHGDDRGFFRQTWVASEIEAVAGATPGFVQGNHSRSSPGVLRGFHAEPWTKMVYVATGHVLAAVADLRPDSATFGAVETFELGDGTDRRRLLISEGLGNAYCVLGDQPADYLYDVTTEWSPGVEKFTIAWDDPTLAVDWPLTAPILSQEDSEAPTLRACFPDHALFGGPAAGQDAR